GTIDPDNQTLTGGIPYTDRPDGIRFFFKYLPTDIDTMFLGAFLTKWNETTLSADTIGMTGYLNSDTYDTYTETELPFIWQSNENPDTLNIIFTSSGFNGNAGSSLFIDSLSMFYGIPVSPTFCFPAKDLTSSSFTANWMTVPNATSYSLDISENSDFSSFLTGYENLNTGTDTFYVVNVSPGTYYYRVRVNYDTETSINSNTIEVPLENTGIKEFNSEDIKIKSISNLISVESLKLNLNYIEIYNIEGQLIKIINISGNKAEFSLPTSGMYILKIYSGNKIISKKVNVIF
ncbi:MAG: T9SS type A sorting domain-containing protein, partial [Chlorobi bacterium]|nr:T9SS type A sorting domain-containing protein [Chlorobiota bacterium]